jgi:uncharacterized membrane protein
MSWQWTLVLVIVPALLAGWFGSDGLALAVLGGAVVVVLSRLQRRIADLERQVGALRGGTAAGAAASAVAAEAAADASTRTPHVAETPAASADERQDTTGREVRPTLPEPAMARAANVPDTAPVPPAVDDRSTRVTSSVGQSLIAWFRGGNTIVRAGVVILFIGVAFLLRFAAEHAVLPIEARLAGVALFGLALWVVGWRLRSARRGYALSLQGAGIGVLYLVVFAGMRLYGLVPAPLAFGLLAALSVLTALLAVRQDALPLAVLAFGGGFLAPVLTSTGQGSHVALFSYYLVLNAAIAWIAHRQAWKLLNLVGFAFTFVIGTAWGVRSYEPALYASTQLFLALHFALYLAICVGYSRQLAAAPDEARLRYVDGGLLFGLPIVAFGLQAAIVKHLPYGLALSSAVLSGVYLLLGRWLWRQAGSSLRLLTEGLLALGLVFLVLVTPLALDARWTGAAWAVQGAGLLWIALRQHRGWAAAMGLVLQLLAAASFWGDPLADADALPWLNARLLGALLLGGAALVSARLLLRAASAGAVPWPGASRPLPAWVPDALHWLMLALGVLQAVLGVWLEAESVQAPFDDAWRGVMVLVLAVVALELAQARLHWPQLGVAGRALAGLAVLTSLAAVLDADTAQRFGRFFTELGWLEAAVVLAAGGWMQRRLRHDDAGPWRRSLPVEHLALGWYALVQAGLQSHALAGHFVVRHASWTATALIVLPTLLALRLAANLRDGGWPASAHPRTWREGLLQPWLALLAVWALVVNAVADAGMQPLPYLPLVNPVDLGHALGALYAMVLLRAGLVSRRPLLVGAAVVGFAWLNGMLVRSLHHWAGTPMWLDGALDTGIVQTGLTILWTALALIAMLYASRKAGADVARRVWIGGAAMLAVVVAKLFFVDLSSIGTLERIVSFLGVGMLMLVIGYVSPLPPGAAAREASS